jgi:hypothetical protein
MGCGGCMGREPWLTKLREFRMLELEGAVAAMRCLDNGDPRRKSELYCFTKL